MHRITRLVPESTNSRERPHLATNRERGEPQNLPCETASRIPQISPLIRLIFPSK